MVATDDAYVQADNTLIAPRVSGYISQVLVTDNQPVKAGQVLARIDDRDYQTALRQATADRETAESEIRSIDAQLTLQNSTIEQASQQVDGGRSGVAVRPAGPCPLRSAVPDRCRNHAIGPAEPNRTLMQRTAGLPQARAALAAAKQQVDVLQATRVKAQAQLEHYRAAEQQAG